MKRVLPLLGVCGSTALLFVLLVHCNVFSQAIRVLDFAFAAPPPWTQVSNLYVDANTQEVTHGVAPLGSLQRLATYWGARPKQKKVLFLGNSQMYAVSLAPGEAPAVAPEKTYVDEVADELNRRGHPVLVYRLSAGSLSYSEALWYIVYMQRRPELRPGYIVLQVNYQSFWNGGIRTSMLPLLDDPAFRAEITEIATSGKPYAEPFAEALASYDKHQAAGTEEHASPVSANLGERIDQRVRSLLQRLPGFQRSADIKDSFVQLLYRERLYFLRLKPTTGRSISGARLVNSRATVEAIVAYASARRIPLLLVNAAVNPQVHLYRSAADRENFVAFLQSTRCPLLDLENSVDGRLWGKLFNGPDPLHMSRQGHRIFAERLVPAIEKMTTPVAEKGKR